MKRIFAVALFVVVGLVGVGAGPAPAQPQSPSTLDVVEVKGFIDATMVTYVSDRLAAAEVDEVDAVILQIDTPGGLDASMRGLVQYIVNSDVPVIAWVAPRGARASSAGTFVLYASHRAYMAEATELGAATPINLGTGEAADQKIVESTIAYLRGLADLRERNADWAEDAVRTGDALSATEADRIGAIDGIASSLSELLTTLDGEVVTSAGSVRRFETWDEARGVPSARVRFQDMGLLRRLLHAITTPDFAYLLLLVGMFGIIFEIYNPGIGLAGVLGAIALLLGFYALSALPTNWAAVLLIVAAVIFFVIDLQAAGLGVWTAGGVAALIAGGLLLFSGAALGVSIGAIAAAVIGTLIFFISVMTAALRVRLRRPITGEDGLIGAIGVAKTDIAPEGTVMSRGTLWRARTMETGIEAGSKVEIKATEGLVLLVEPLHEKEPHVTT